jgi:ribonuclease Z
MAVKLVFLGTGSGKPLPHRGVSGVALVREGEVFLLDCGEGTQTQLTKSTLRPGALEGVLLTHFHGDHVNGLPGFLGSLTLNQREDALDIVGPQGMRRWFKTMRDLRILWPGFELKVQEVREPGVVLDRGTYRWETAPLKHRVPTWGYRYVEDPRPGRFDVDAARALKIPAGPLFGRLQNGESVELDDGRVIEPEQVLGPSRPGLRVAYCTDTSPCEGAEQLAEGADVLVHESTYPGGMERLAHERGHSTSADAARLAKSAGVKKLILTHFSQKYPRTDIFVDKARAIFAETYAAEDLAEFEVERPES